MKKKYGSKSLAMQRQYFKFYFCAVEHQLFCPYGKFYLGAVYIVLAQTFGHFWRNPPPPLLWVNIVHTESMQFWVIFWPLHLGMYYVHSPVLQSFVLSLEFEVNIPSKNDKWWCNCFQVRNVKLFVRSGLWGDPSSMQLYTQLSFGGLRRISKHLLWPQTYMHVKNPNGNRKIQSGKPRTC